MGDANSGGILKSAIGFTGILRAAVGEDGIIWNLRHRFRLVICICLEAGRSMVQPVTVSCPDIGRVEHRLISELGNVKICPNYGLDEGVPGDTTDVEGGVA